MTLVGIDLGTTFSLIARLTEDGDAQIIPNAEGDLTMPSVVCFESAEDVVVGKHAVRALSDTPEHVIQHPKRYLGDADHADDMHGQSVSPIAASSLILRKLKQDAEQQVGPIGGAVITVPAYFDEARRQATVTAGELAGLKVIDIINEPTAAALASAYLSAQRNAENADEALDRLMSDTDARHTIVYDLGGGTFDVTLMKQTGPELQVLATAGDVELGGIDWTERIAEQVAEFFVATHEVDPRQDALGRARLRSAANQVKHELSSRRAVTWEFAYKGKHIEGKMTREAFDADTSDLLYRTENRLNRVLRDAELAWQDVDSIVAVGGSSRLPQVLEMLERVSGNQPDTSLSPDHIVSLGAAIHAAMLGAQLTQAELDAVAKNADESVDAPVTEEQANDDDQGEDSDDPLDALQKELEGDDDNDAGTGHGETKTAAPRTRRRKKKQEAGMMLWGKSVLQMLHLLKTNNVSSHSLGVIARDKNGTKRVTTMIPRNTKLPKAVTKVFGTIVDDQKRITATVVEGEADDPAHCISVCTCTVTNLPTNLPRNSPVQVRFRYDSSGRLHVGVVHLTSGAFGEVVIKRDGGVDPERVRIAQKLLQRLKVG
ncbi:MAG: Hsp70 family protein [Phycisphaeraceae bacterium]|nr:Hsp70 family protein [Phycisphaeraceae bacterium]